jgi:hypothetical protein
MSALWILKNKHVGCVISMLIIFLSKKCLINAVSEAVILSTLSYQEAWEMVNSLFLGLLFVFKSFII